ncbi:BRCA1-associated protein [Trichinella pseudospiralis]|uniref:BRCA1-associated protein n=2 Tax=Trichinella pseudospiralis TaxID=6337 RepID=A0A0V1ESV1_TRIPS|nr:BRCA1-associated protein [Trichinella pseudospiralis]
MYSLGKLMKQWAFLHFHLLKKLIKCENKYFSADSEVAFFMPITPILVRIEVHDDSIFLNWQDSESEVMSSKNNEASVAENAEVCGRRSYHSLSIEFYKSCSNASLPLPDNGDCQDDSADKQEVFESIPFSCGNPFIESTKGILHIYKPNESSTASPGQILCMLCVPTTLSSHNLLQFLSPFCSAIKQIRIIRDGTPDAYMVLIYFKDAELCMEFYELLNGTPFNSIEPDICHLVFVARVEVLKSSNGGNWPVDGYTELPTCPVCLERMDESVNGILTVLCNHSFHASCLSQWSDSTCPVCRYYQTPELIRNQKCATCGKSDDLWICLICGNIGCGRYVEGHAIKHFEETQHTFSLEVGGQRVWDYVGDNYVHRLIQGKSDGKLIQFDRAAHGLDDIQNEEKIEAVTLEYTYLLTSQLDSQRKFFEEKLANVEKLACVQIDTLEDELKRLLKECQKLKSDLHSSTTDKCQLEKKNRILTSKYENALKQLSDEKQMNKCMLQNQDEYKSTIEDLKEKLSKITKEKDQEIAELQEQVHDLLVHVEAKTKLTEAGNAVVEELQEGRIFVGPSNISSTNQNPAASSRKSNRRRRN